jgi:hypothetical protein
MWRNNASLRKLMGESGGVRPRARVRCERHLSLAEQEGVSRGLARRLSLRAIADELSRAPSTICREVNAYGGRPHYRALKADDSARRRDRRPPVAKLARHKRLGPRRRPSWPPSGRPKISGWLAKQPRDVRVARDHLPVDLRAGQRRPCVHGVPALRPGHATPQALDQVRPRHGRDPRHGHDHRAPGRGPKTAPC